MANHTFLQASREKKKYIIRTRILSKTGNTPKPVPLWQPIQAPHIWKTPSCKLFLIYSFSFSVTLHTLVRRQEKHFSNLLFSTELAQWIARELKLHLRKASYRNLTAEITDFRTIRSTYATPKIKTILTVWLVSVCSGKGALEELEVYFCSDA